MEKQKHDFRAYAVGCGWEQFGRRQGCALVDKVQTSCFALSSSSSFPQVSRVILLLMSITRLSLSLTVTFLFSPCAPNPAQVLLDIEKTNRRKSCSWQISTANPIAAVI